MPDENGARWIPNNNYFANRNGYKPAYVILHGTAGGTSADAIANYFASTQGTAKPASSHYIIGVDGIIVQAVREQDGAWANGFLTQGHDPWWDPNINPNNITITIEHCKPSTDNSDSLTPQQQAASFKLVQHICQRWNIPMRAADANGGITGHYSIDPVNRSHCPGPYPWDALWAFLKGANTVGIPAGWKDDGTTLTAPNGLTVRAGFRDYILTNAWAPEDFPMELEHGQNPLEIGNTSLGEGTQQVFRISILEWIKSQNKVIKAWGGQELLAYRAQLANAQKTIDALKAQVAQPQQATNVQEHQLVTDLRTIKPQLSSIVSRL